MAALAIVGTLRQHAPQFLRYCTVGAVNTILDFTIYTTLTRGWSFWRSHYLLANATSFVIVVTWSFFWNKRWTFRDRSVRSSSAASDEPSGGRALPATRRRSEQATVAEGVGPRANRKVRPVLVQYMKFVAVTFGGIIIAQSVLFTGVRLLRLHDLVAKVFAGPLVVMWNFLMYRFWAFRTPSAGRESMKKHESPNGRSAYPLIREESANP